MKVRPGWLLVKPILEPLEEKTEGGIVVPFRAAGTILQEAEIIAASGYTVDTGFSEGQIVVYQANGGFAYRHHGVDLVFLPTSCVLAHLDD